MYFSPNTNLDPTSVKAKRTCAGTYSVVWGENKEMTDWKQVANKGKPNKAAIMYHGCTSTLCAIHCSAEEPDEVLKISRAMMNWSKVPEIKTRQDHCKRHPAISDRCVFVCEAEGEWVGGCVSYMEWVFGEQEHQEDEKEQSQERHHLPGPSLSCVQG